MNASSLESKTIRPGSLGNYSYYHSARRPAAAPRPAYISASRRRLIPHAKTLVIALTAISLGVGGSILQSRAGQAPVASTQSAAPSAGAPKAAPVAPGKAPAASAGAVLAATSDSKCAGNTHDKAVIISVSQRRMWACEQARQVHQAPVITGMLAHASTLTPAGTYQIYAKATDTVLTGSDEAGSWNRPVYYWMPFLDNQYGTYGFHDATWRPDKEFGKIDPNTDQASHGCVELPLASQKWLYEWAPVGTTVTVET